MENLLKKLLENKILSITSLVPIGAIVVAVIMVWQGNIDIPFYVSIGVFVLTGVPISIVSIVKAKKTKIPEFDFVSEFGLEKEQVLRLINKNKNRKSLLSHPIFSDLHSEWASKINRIEYNDLIRNKGQYFILKTFLKMKLNIVLDRIRSHISRYENIINDDFTHKDISGFIEVINNSVNSSDIDFKGYENIALETGIPDLFIDEFNKIHYPILKRLKIQLNSIKDCELENDYNKYMLVLNFIKLAFDETFSNEHINDIIKINGRLDPVYNFVTDLLDKGLDKEEFIFFKLKREEWK